VSLFRGIWLLEKGQHGWRIIIIAVAVVFPGCGLLPQRREKKRRRKRKDKNIASILV